MKCKDVYLHICDNLDQQLDSPRCREIRKHLASCPECKAYLDSLKKTVVLYRAVSTPQHIPSAAHRKLFKIIRTIDISARQRTRARKSD